MTNASGNGQSPPHDPVRALLVARSCPPHIVDGGFPGLIASWSDVVRQIETGYTSSLDEYINDMDLRDLISAAQQVANQLSGDVLNELQSADGRLLEVTEACPCVWGPEIESEDDLTPAQDWWYYRRPKVLTEHQREEWSRWGLA